MTMEMEMSNLTQLDLDALLEGAVLVRESRSGVTQDWCLPDNTLLEIYYYKSGRIEATPISGENKSLTIRF